MPEKFEMWLYHFGFLFVLILSNIHCTLCTSLTTASMGPGNSGNIDFSLCKAGVYAQHCGDIFMVKALPKAWLISQPVHVKLPQSVWAWNQKPHSSTALWGRCWGQNMALKPHFVSAISGPIGARLTNDWCINGYEIYDMEVTKENHGIITSTLNS